MNFSGCLLLALFAGAAAWQDCDRVFHDNRQTFKTNEYIRVWNYDLGAKEPAFIIKVKSCKNARIRLLTDKDNLESLGYNFNIDIKDGNSFATSINRRTGTQFEKSKVVRHSQFLNCNEYTDFWVSWDYDAGRLAIGKGSDPNSNEYGNMIYTGNSKLDVKYVAVASGADIRADWKIYEQCELPVTVVEPACSSAKACDGEAICIQGKCVECPVDHVVESGVCKRVCIKDADCDANNACDFLKDVCNKCPAGTAPREGSCDETCSTSSDCKNPLSSCLDGFCDACGDLEIVEKNACVSICDLKKDEGDCSNKVSRFFYKAATAQCLEFKSCAQADGLSNNFGSKETCKTCEPKPLPAECLLNADVGTCENYQVRYMYNKNLKKCKKFTYNGCDGNKNNFPTKDACHQYCAKYD